MNNLFWRNRQIATVRNNEKSEQSMDSFLHKYAVITLYTTEESWKHTRMLSGPELLLFQRDLKSWTWPDFRRWCDLLRFPSKCVTDSTYNKYLIYKGNLRNISNNARRSHDISSLKSSMPTFKDFNGVKLRYENFKQNRRGNFSHRQ